MPTPGVPGAINVVSLTGDEIIELNPFGPRRAQTTTQDIANLAPGGGDVVGPASAVDGNLAVFNGTTGKLLKDGGSAKALTVNAQTGTTYTLLTTDNGKLVTLSNAGAITLTVPAGLGAGFNCALVQLGAGAFTPTASGTTINSNGGLTVSNGQYAVCSLIATAANVFVFAGDRA